MQEMTTTIEGLIPALRRYARSLLRGDRTAADDLVQDCLERVICRWHQKRPDSTARAWAFAILHNLALNHLRQAARRGTHVPLEDADEGAFTSAPTQDSRLRHRELLAALATLPEEQRSVLLLVGVEDLSSAETGQVLGVPVGTVMSRLSRARERLARTMEEGTTAVAVTSPVLRRVK